MSDQPTIETVAPPETKVSEPKQRKQRSDKGKSRKRTREDGSGLIREGKDVSRQGGKTYQSRATEHNSVFSSLSPKHQAFVSAYSDRNSPTFSNGVKSALAANIGNGNYAAAGTSAHELLKSGQIRSAIAERLEEAGIGIKVRADTINEIAKQRTTEILHYDGEGNLVQRQVVDNSTNRLKAVALASKIAGDADSSRAALNIERQAMQPLIAQWTRKLRAELSLPKGTPDTLQAGYSASEPTDGQTDGISTQDAAEGQEHTQEGSGDGGTEGVGG